MDHDIGWAAKEITLTADAPAQALTLPCRWVEYIQTWDDKGSLPFFLATVTHTDRLSEASWQHLAFKDAAGKQHRYVVRDALEIKPNVIRLTKLG